jgi:hypothetical protein
VVEAGKGAGWGVMVTPPFPGPPHPSPNASTSRSADGPPRRVGARTEVAAASPGIAPAPRLDSSAHLAVPEMIGNWLLQGCVPFNFPILGAPAKTRSGIFPLFFAGAGAVAEAAGWWSGVPWVGG